MTSQPCKGDWPLGQCICLHTFEEHGDNGCDAKVSRLVWCQCEEYAPEPKDVTIATAGWDPGSA